MAATSSTASGVPQVTREGTNTSLVGVNTTTPIFETLAPPIRYHSAYLRPLQLSDMEAYQSYLKQSEPRICLGQAKDTDLSSSHPRSSLRIRGTDEGVHFGIFLNNSDSTEPELIGEGGVNIHTPSWPELYCSMLKKKNWEPCFIQSINAMKDYWWSLPRKETYMEVYSFSLLVDSQGIERPIELLCARVQQEHSEELVNMQKEGYLSSFIGTEKLPSGEIYWRNFTFATVSTTIPLLNNSFLPILSDRLYIRLLELSDMKAYHSLRSQPEPMYGLSKIKPNIDIAQTQKDFEHKQEDLTQIKLGIFKKSNKTGNLEGEFIGEGGVNMFKGSWPSIFYSLKKEHWGKGYATEFVKAFLQHWWNLPRKEVEVKVYPAFVDFPPMPIGRIPIKPELLCAVTKDNEASEKVLKKIGFNHCGTIKTGDKLWRLERNEI